MGDFFGFRKMISTGFIKAVYAVGAAILTFGGLIMILFGSSVDSSSLKIGVLAVTVGNLAWRMICEGVIVFYRIHDTLESINCKIGNQVDL